MSPGGWCVRPGGVLHTKLRKVKIKTPSPLISDNVIRHRPRSDTARSSPQNRLSTTQTSIT